MAATYKLIEAVTLDALAASITFTNIPPTYDDLVVTVSAGSVSYPTFVLMQFNGSWGPYRYSIIRGSDSGVQSLNEQLSSGTSMLLGHASWMDTFTSNEAYIPNYAGSTNKSVAIAGVHEEDSGWAAIIVGGGLWEQTDAITSITLFTDGDELAEYTSAQIYGVTKA